MEYFDIYDNNGNKTGKIVSHDYNLKKDEYRYITHVCIFNQYNQLLIQKRCLSKKDWPGAWDISSGGGVNSGENSKTAAIRETKEELGIDLGNLDRPYLSVYFQQGYDDYYFVNLDKVKPILKKDEVLDWKWASKEEISILMKNFEFVQYKEGFIELLFSLKEQRGSYLL